MRGSFLLVNGIVANPGSALRADVRVEGSRITGIGEGLPVLRGDLVLDCSGRYIYPGLINAHDHLSFSLFPRLGDPPYPNSYAWGNEIRSKYKAVIDPIVMTPLRDRLFWGAWKNLFSGVTTVMHHDPYFSPFRFGYPVDVIRRYTFAHSLGFEKDFRGALRHRRRGTPFILHLAEGTDERAAAEVRELEKLGGLDDRTVAVHGVGIRQGDIEILQKAQTAVIWCPSSNRFLFGRSAPIASLWGRIPMAIGTDSTITGSESLFGELRAAQREYALTPRELFSLVTDSPRRILRLPEDRGAIVNGGVADLFVLPAAESSPYSTLLHAEPGNIALLLRRGRVVFHDTCFDRAFGHDGASSSRITLNHRPKWISSRRFLTLHPSYRRLLAHYTYLN